MTSAASAQSLPTPSSASGEFRSEPPLSQVQYERSTHYHPFARKTGELEWVVEDPTSGAQLGVVRADQDTADGPFFLAYRMKHGAPAKHPAKGIHPTLFHAVSWLRWRADFHR